MFDPDDLNFKSNPMCFNLDELKKITSLAQHIDCDLIEAHKIFIEVLNKPELINMFGREVSSVFILKLSECKLNDNFVNISFPKNASKEINVYRIVELSDFGLFLLCC